MTNSFPQIRAAAIDGRAVNVYYRQRQIERLHDAITKVSTEILKAIETDYHYAPAEAAIEMHLAMQALKLDYASLQPKQAHHDEYLIASGKNAGSNRRPVGVVYIEPCSKHTLFYSVVVPLSSAMATGNCVIVLVSSTAGRAQQRDTNKVPAREQPAHTLKPLEGSLEFLVGQRHLCNRLSANKRRIAAPVSLDRKTNRQRTGTRTQPALLAGQ